MTDQTKLAEIKRDLEARSHNYGAYYCVDDMAIIARQLLAMLEQQSAPVDDAEIAALVEYHGSAAWWPQSSAETLLRHIRQQQQTIAAARRYIQKQDLRTLNELKALLGGAE